MNFFHGPSNTSRVFFLEAIDFVWRKHQRANKQPTIRRRCLLQQGVVVVDLSFVPLMTNSSRQASKQASEQYCSLV
jgi:hypothetical protein